MPEKSSALLKDALAFCFPTRPTAMSLLQFIALCVASTFIAAFFFLRSHVSNRRRLIRYHARAPFSVLFLHPAPLAGGGGERVLWLCIAALRQKFPSSLLAIAGGWATSGAPSDVASGILSSTLNTQFGLIPGDNGWDVRAVEAPAKWTDASIYRRLTLLLQALGAMAFGARAYWSCPTDVVVDSANLAFALIVPKLMGARTVSYVHYPTISTDMLQVVRDRTETFNNSSAVARSSARTFAKLAYYHAFAKLYAVAGLCADIALANSSWTQRHLRSLWWNRRIERLFPPVPSLLATGDDGEDCNEKEPRLIVSLGQFRAEKNHIMQLHAMRILRKTHPDSSVKLVMIGGVRGKADRARAEKLERIAHEEKLPVQVRVDIAREEVVRVLKRASVGLHTMKHEHFGISVAELQSAGLVVIAHKSGGVELDIVENEVSGLLVDGNAEEFAQRIVQAFDMNEEKKQTMISVARKAAKRFSDEAFQNGFLEHVETIDVVRNGPADQR